MPSLALGKLLPSGPKQNPAQDVTGRRTRGRASSEKRSRDLHPHKPPTPPEFDPSLADLTPSRRRTPRSDSYHDTDDYGFPVVDHLPLQQIADSMHELSRTMLKGKCRTCGQSYSAPAMSIWRCDQCQTANGMTSSARIDLDRPARPLSVSRTQEVLDHLLDEGLKRLPSIKPDSLAIPAPQDAWKRHSGLDPPKLPIQSMQRRGSAPDTALPALPIAANGQRPSMRRKSPGRLRNDSRGRNESPLPSPVRVTTPGGFENAPPNGMAIPSPKHSHPTQRRPRLEPRDPTREAFKAIFEYLSDALRRPNLNISFSTVRSHRPGRSHGDHGSRTIVKRSLDARSTTPPPQISQMGHKELMVGDVYDVATSLVAGQSSPSRRPASSGDPWTPKLVSAGSPHIDWKYVQKWYEIILHMSIRHDETGESPTKEEPDPRTSQALEDLGYAIRGSVLDMMEHLLLTPQQAPSEPQDVRYLLILLANPLLMSPKENPTRSRRQRSSTLPASQSASKQNLPPQNVPKASWNASKQSRVLSLLLGVLSNASAECHSQMVQWFSRYPEDIFCKQIDMLLAFVNERILLRSLGHKSPRKNARPGYNGFQPTQMFDDMLQSDVIPKELNGDDWQLRSACKVLQLFVRANDIYHGKPLTARPTPASVTTRRRPVVKQLMPTDHFYNAQLDSEDKFNPRRDFDEWEKKEPGLQLSAYPFLLTLSVKMQILEFDAKRKMASKVREEFFDSIARNTNLEKYFHLKVRRRCMVEDSLTRISEAISSSEGEAKKALKVQFDGEEGIDAGGLRKEWFLLLVRELLDPDVGLFLYNEETNYCYFNPLSLESSEQYQLVGAVLGLAIYNFTILDVPFPPFLFRKLAAAAPPSMLAAAALDRPAWRPELDDLAQLDPTLARSLQHVLDYAGNVGEDIGAVFRVDTLQYGRVREHALVAGGGERAVTRKTRDEYVDLYVEYVLDKAVRRHFEPFARGFFSVCGGAALALFRGEEIEMLIRGSGDVDFSELRGRAEYEGWRDPSVEGGEGPELTSGADVEAAFPVVRWFWELMALSGAADQRRVLRWITGSDRVPTAGVGAGLVLRIQCLGGDCERLPQARTCFNMLQLWNYATRRCFVRKFWYAVVESEGFGLK